jgi:hypothetical protein
MKDPKAAWNPRTLGLEDPAFIGISRRMARVRTDEHGGDDRARAGRAPPDVWLLRKNARRSWNAGGRTRTSTCVKVSPALRLP